MYVVAVEFVVKPERAEEFRPVVLAQARNSLAAEPGCVQFDVCVDPQDRQRVFLYEVYTDEAAFQEHLETSHLADFNARVRDWLISKDVAVWRRLPPYGDL